MTLHPRSSRPAEHHFGVLAGSLFVTLEWLHGPLLLLLASIETHESDCFDMMLAGARQDLRNQAGKVQVGSALISAQITRSIILLSIMIYIDTNRDNLCIAHVNRNKRKQT